MRRSPPLDIQAVASCTAATALIVAHLRHQDPDQAQQLFEMVRRMLLDATTAHGTAPVLAAFDQACMKLRSALAVTDGRVLH